MERLLESFHPKQSSNISPCFLATRCHCHSIGTDNLTFVKQYSFPTWYTEIDFCIFQYLRLNQQIFQGSGVLSFTIFNHKQTIK